MTDNPKYGIGQAVFIRTDTPDYSETTIPFASLEELVAVCSEGRPNLTLERVIIYAMSKDEPVALTLGFISASMGQRPGELKSQFS
jgi:hypothetical protein